VDARGAARMVDVSEKPETERRAVAEGAVRLSARARRLVRANALEKGDVLATARLAGIQAAKRAADLIPLCHPLRIDAVDVSVVAPPRGPVRIRAEVRVRDRTGAEMEALTAVAVAALVVYDMVKAVDRGAAIEGVRLLEKSGGKSGPWRRRGSAPR
jgi:cyclic pyranopterin phosphate synthase